MEAALGMRPAGAGTGRHIGKMESSVFLLTLHSAVPCPQPLLCPTFGSLQLEPGPFDHHPATECAAVTGHPLGRRERGQPQTMHGSVACLAGAPSSRCNLWEGSKMAAGETAWLFVSAAYPR